MYCQSATLTKPSEDDPTYEQQQQKQVNIINVARFSE
jgi:hypothetical protein